jgi:hypothetical protein
MTALSARGSTPASLSLPPALSSSHEPSRRAAGPQRGRPLLAEKSAAPRAAARPHVRTHDFQNNTPAWHGIHRCTTHPPRPLLHPPTRPPVPTTTTTTQLSAAPVVRTEPQRARLGLSLAKAARTREAARPRACCAELLHAGRRHLSSPFARRCCACRPAGARWPRRAAHARSPPSARGCEACRRARAAFKAVGGAGPATSPPSALSRACAAGLWPARARARRLAADGRGAPSPSLARSLAPSRSFCSQMHEERSKARSSRQNAHRHHELKGSEHGGGGGRTPACRPAARLRLPSLHLARRGRAGARPLLPTPLSALAIGGLRRSRSRALPRLLARAARYRRTVPLASARARAVLAAGWLANSDGLCPSLSVRGRRALNV